MRPSSTKRGYIISHLDLSKSVAENEPPHGGGASSVRSMSTFVFLDFLHGALASAGFCRRCFCGEVDRERDDRADEPSTQDFKRCTAH
jgi:hypothetical protein